MSRRTYGKCTEFSVGVEIVEKLYGNLFFDHRFKDVIKDVMFSFPINLESKIPLNITRVII